MYNYKINRNRAALGEELMQKLGEMKCKPHKALYHAFAPNSNKSGFHLMELMTMKPLRSQYRSGVRIVRGIGKIGSGVGGVVYIGCTDEECKNEIAIKTTHKPRDIDLYRHEYNIMRELKGISPCIPMAYGYQKCDNYAVLYTE